MTTLLILAILGQIRYADEFAGPPAVRPSAEFAEPFPARRVPAELRAPKVVPPAPPLLTLPDQVFAPQPLPKLPADVFAPAPVRRRIIRVVGREDRPDPDPAPTPGIKRPEEEALSKRLAEVEHRVDVLERLRGAATPAKAAHPIELKACSPYICNCNAGGECAAPDNCHCGPDHGPGLHHAQAATPQAVAPPVAKGWRGIVGEPGVEGFGALNDAGQIVVEQRRCKAVPVTTYATYQPPVSYQQPVIYQEPSLIYATPYGAGSVCGPGGCGVSGRGLFGGRFR